MAFGYWMLDLLRTTGREAIYTLDIELYTKRNGQIVHAGCLTDTSSSLRLDTRQDQCERRCSSAASGHINSAILPGTPRCITIYDVTSNTPLTDCVRPCQQVECHPACQNSHSTEIKVDHDLLLSLVIVHDCNDLFLGRPAGILEVAVRLNCAFRRPLSPECKVRVIMTLLGRLAVDGRSYRGGEFGLLRLAVPCPMGRLD